MKLHIVQGKPGCAFARTTRSVAVIVDALRASATAAMLLDAGALELLVVAEVDQALALKATHPDALLFGERQGLPPAGFDAGNSPRDVARVRGRRIIFTTTTGAQRLIAAWGSAAVYMGTTVNASAVMDAAAKTANESHAAVVLIPAGLATDPLFSAQEDWVGATALAMRCDAEVLSGADAFSHWKKRIAREGIPALFAQAPHAQKLRALGLAQDIDFCAQIDVTAAIPQVVSKIPYGLMCKRAHSHSPRQSHS